MTIGSPGGRVVRCGAVGEAWFCRSTPTIAPNHVITPQFRHRQTEITGPSAARGRFKVRALDFWSRFLDSYSCSHLTETGMQHNEEDPAGRNEPSWLHHPTSVSSKPWARGNTSL
jgi:hypothetical protein